MVPILLHSVFYLVVVTNRDNRGRVLGVQCLEVADIRIAYGGMAATPKRARAVEAALLGKPWTEATVEAAISAYDLDFTPLTDVRATAGYRQLAAKNLLRRFFAETSDTKAPLTVTRHEAA